VLKHPTGPNHGKTSEVLPMAKPNPTTNPPKIPSRDSGSAALTPRKLRLEATKYARLAGCLIKSADAAAKLADQLERGARQ
jgi:hypothetical protein